LLLLCLTGIAGSSELVKTKNEIKHANTYFWLALAEKGNMESFYSGLNHIKTAENILRDFEKTEEVDNLLNEIKILRKDFLSQMEVHFDTLHGVFPLVRMLVPNIFSDALTLGTYELVDDPAVMASTSAGLKMARDIVGNWNSKPQLNVIFNSNTGEKLKHKKSNIALEQEVLYVFESLPKFFVHNSQEVRRYLTNEEYEIYKAGIGFLPIQILEKLYTGFDCKELLVVSVNEEDVINDIHYYITEGHLYSVNITKPTHTFFQNGFSRNRNKYFWPIIASFFIGFIVCIIAFRSIVYKGNIKKVFSLSGKYIIVAMVSYLIGRISPWIILPLISNIMPVPGTLYFLSFWWPCLVGVALFFIPALIYLQLNKYLFHLDEDFEIMGHGAAIFVSISIGVCFYLLTPFMLYWNSINGLARISSVFLISGFIFYSFGSALDHNEYKVTSNTLLSGIYLFPVLFVFGGTIFFGETLPIKDFWQLPSQMWAYGLLIISAFLAGCYHQFIKVGPDVIEGPENPDDETKFLPVQKLIHSIKTSEYEYWESKQFKEIIDPIINPLTGKQTEPFKTTWLELTGPAGCGKTAAANAMIKRIEKDYEGTVIQFIGQCHIKGNDEIAQTPYEPFYDAFPEYLISPLISSENILSKIGDSLDPGNMIPSFLGLDSFFSALGNDSTQAMDEKKQEKIFQTISKYIREKAEKNMVVIFFDNMQEIDPASEKLLQFLKDQFPADENLELLYLIVQRNCDNRFQLEGLTPFELDFPDRNGLTKMICHALNIEEKSSQLICNEFDLLMDDKLSAMFQYISILAEDKILILSETGNTETIIIFTLSKKYFNGEGLPEPQSYYEIIKTKLDTLSKEQVKVISYAACLGENFDVEMLSGCLKDEELIDKLEEIEKLSGIVYDNSEEDGCFSFKDSITLRKVRDILNISFEGPSWPSASEKVKMIHEKIAVYLLERVDEDVNNIFDICTQFYSSGGRNAQKAMENCLMAVKVGTNSFNFDLAKKYTAMAIDCADFLGLSMNREEEMLLIECEKAHVQNINTSKIADRCIKYYKQKQKSVSIKILKAMARVCYEAGRNKGISGEDKTNTYQKNGQESAEQLLIKSNDNFSKAEAYFYKAINGENLETEIKNITECIEYLGFEDKDKNFQTEPLAAWAEDFLARRLLGKNPENQIEPIRLFSSSISRKRLLNDKHGLSISLGGLGACLVKEKRYSEARACFQESLSFAKQVNDIFGEYLRCYDLGDSYLVEIKESSDTKSSKYYYKAMGHFQDGFRLVDQLDEDSKNISQFHLFSGLLYCCANLDFWDDFDKNGDKLLNLIQKRVGAPWLYERIYSAIDLSSDRSNDWGKQILEILKKDVSKYENKL